MSLFRFRITHHFIIFWLCLAAFVHNILMNGANNVVISSLQKEFYVTSKETGVYVSIYDVGSLISNMFVPVLGSKGSRPRWVAFGMVILFAGSMINVIPHFLRSKHSIYNSNNLVDQDLLSMGNDDGNLVQMCNFSISTSGAFSSNQTSTMIFNHQSNDNNIGANNHAHSQEIFKFFALKHLLYLANMVNGFSSASLTSLALSYIEDIAPEKIASFYESIYFATGAFGVGVGFLVTSKFLNIYTDVDTADSLPQWLVPNHPNWIGAWWIPYLVFGIVSLVLAIIICTFPRNLNKQKRTKPKHLEKTKNSEELANLNDKESTKPNGASKTGQQLPPPVIMEPKLYDGPNEVEIETPDYKEQSRPRILTEGSEILHAIENAGSMLSLNHAGICTVPRKSELGHLDDTASKTKKEDTFMDILKKASGLAKNPVYVFLVLTVAIEGLLQNSFLAFASLFIEYQYRLTSGGASLLLGLLCIPPLMIGGLIGGLVVKKLEDKLVPCLKFICIAIAFNIIIYFGFLFYCPEPAMIGNMANSPYWQPKMTEHALSHPNDNICFSKASNCNCDEKIFKPVCLQDSNDIIFPSSCIAGCTIYDHINETYTGCSQDRCMDYYMNSELSRYFNSSDGKLLEQIRKGTFVNGLCKSNSCVFKTIVAYTSIVLLMFMNALMYVPYVKVAIACANDKQMNSIVLGVKQLAMNAIGTIPGPIIFGAVIDLTCSYWHTDSSGQKVCKIYNNKNFSIAFAFLGVGFKILCFIFIFLSLLCSIRIERKKKAQSGLAKTANGVS